MKHLFKNTTSSKLLVLFFLAIITALALVFVSPLWLGDDTKTHAAPAQSMSQQGTPALPPTISQGVSVHGVPAWEHDGYTGGTVKVGVIVIDFYGFADQGDYAHFGESDSKSYYFAKTSHTGDIILI